jgi:hypothetical protein
MSYFVTGLVDTDLRKLPASRLVRSKSNLCSTVLSPLNCPRPKIHPFGRFYPEVKSMLLKK